MQPDVIRCMHCIIKQGGHALTWTYSDSEASSRHRLCEQDRRRCDRRSGTFMGLAMLSVSVSGSSATIVGGRAAALDDGSSSHEMVVSAPAWGQQCQHIIRR